MTFKLVGIDLETGGLNGYQILEDGTRVHGAGYYPIIEAAVVVLDLELKELGRLAVGVWKEDMMERMSPWSLKNHLQSGLIDSLRNPKGNHDIVVSSSKEMEDVIMSYLESMGIPKYNHKEREGGFLIGNSIGFDQSFLDAQAPQLYSHFSFRGLDISTLAICRNTVLRHLDLPYLKKQYGHTAMSDIQESIKELKGYVDHLS